VEIVSEVFLQFQCCKNQLFCNFLMTCWLLHPSSPSCQKKNQLLKKKFMLLNSCTKCSNPIKP
jgi:hypothetical protein